MGKGFYILHPFYIVVMSDNTAAMAYVNKMGILYQSNITTCPNLLGEFCSNQIAWVSA